jgi:hypothetical protein
MVQFVKKIIGFSIKSVVLTIQKIIKTNENEILIIEEDEKLRNLLLQKAVFYFPKVDTITATDKVRWRHLFFTGLIWIANDPKDKLYWLISYCREHKSILNANPDTNPWFTWELSPKSLLHSLSEKGDWEAILKSFFYFEEGYFNKSDSLYHKNLKIKVIVDESVKRFDHYKSILPKKEKVYVFGTGPSLSKLDNFRQFQDGYKIVCNSFVKNKNAWNQLNPDFICAADGCHHFSDGLVARLFLQDLKQRLQETQTYFIYPLLFHKVVTRVMDKSLHHRLIAVPYILTSDLLIFKNSFGLVGRGGNSLNDMMLPLAISLSKNVYLWGYDGASPKPASFQNNTIWANAEKYSYKNYEEELAMSNKGYLVYHKKISDGSYFDDLQKRLDIQLSEAEMKGHKFYMLHDCYYESLQKRRI